MAPVCIQRELSLLGLPQSGLLHPHAYLWLMTA